MLEEKNIGTVQNGVYKIFSDIRNIVGGKAWAENVPEFVGGVFDGIYSAGDGSFIVCINQATHQSLLEYVQKLELLSYKKHSESVMNGNHFFAYHNDENYIYAYYIENFKTVKIIAEPYYKYLDFTPEKDIVKPAVIASSVCDRNFYVRLPDNTLVVIDGGWRIEDWSRHNYADLFQQMYKEMQEILGGEEIIKIPLWIITHAHTDHCRVLELLYTLPLAQKFDITQILYNFPCDNHIAEKCVATTKEQLDEMKQNFEDWHGNAGVTFPYEKIFYNCPFRIYDTANYENICRNAFRQYGAIQVKAHDGMKFNLSGFEFVVLHTQEDDMPTFFDNNNNISIIIKMTYKGSSMLWLGDMCEIPSTSCTEMYGDFLKSDYMQVSHHGWNAATPEFYEKVKPSVLFWNNSEWGFKYSDKWQGYGKTKISTDLYNMDCVKRNIFCNKIDMSYAYFPVEVGDKVKYGKSDCFVATSAVSDRIFMLKTSENKLIVIDGGWRKEFWEEFGEKVLTERLYKEMAEFVGEEKVTVAAFIVTNSYKHNNRFLETFQNTEINDLVSVEQIVYHFPENENFLDFDNDENYCEILQNEFIKTGAKLVVAKRNDIYDFGDIKAEILYAPMGEKHQNIADSSLVIKLFYKDSSIILTGDMTDRISELLLKECPDKLDSDIVSVANHGWDNCGVLDFYKTCGAKVQLWNNSEYGYQFFRKNQGYKKTKVSTEIYSLVDSDKNLFCDTVKPQIIALPLKK